MSKKRPGSAGHYTLLEIAIAICILCTGAVCALSLVCKSLSQGKMLTGENYSAQAAESFYEYIVNEASANTSDWNRVLSTIPDTIQWSLLSPADKAVMMDASLWGSPLQDDIYYPISQAGFYGINTQTNTGSSNIGDFRGNLLVWKAAAPNDFCYGKGRCNVSTTAVGVYMEISWPAEVDYYSREKRTYYFELYNLN